jgi:hypothetical protein
VDLAGCGGPRRSARGLRLRHISRWTADTGMVRLISLSPASCPPRSSASLAPRGATALLLRLDASFLGPSRLRHFRSLSSRHTETARSGSPAAPTSSIRFQVSDQILPSSCGSLDVLRGIAGCDWRFDAYAVVSANGTVRARYNLAAPSFVLQRARSIRIQLPPKENPAGGTDGVFATGRRGIRGLGSRPAH